MECVLLLFAAVCLLFCVSGNTDIQFAGFVPNTVYTYYTNGVNTHTQLTCNATSDSYTDISATWIDVTGNEDTGSSVLSFKDITTVVVWGYQGDYLCRAVYQTDPEMYQDSDSITVRIKYNTTITVSYGDTTHIRDIENTDYVYIHVMTEDVVISCDAEMALWFYTPTGLSPLTDIPNPITIGLFTIQNATGYSCTVRGINSMRVNVKTVTLKSYGSGVYKQQQDTYTQLTEGESVYISEDTTLVCVSSKDADNSAWFYRNTSSGVNERITEGTEVIRSKGFLTLSLQTTSRAGNYYCKTAEITDTYAFANTEHNIIVSVPMVTTTTSITGPIYTTPIVTKSITTQIVILQTTQTTPGTTAQQTTPTTTQTTTTNNPTEVTTNTQISVIVYAVTGLLLLFVILLVSALVACSLILVRIVLKSKKTNKYKYKQSLEDTTPPTNTASDKKEYISLSEVPVRTKTQQTHKYEPMASLYPQKEYVSLEVTTPPNYYEMSESHFESDKHAKYENLADVISS